MNKWLVEIYKLDYGGSFRLEKQEIIYADHHISAKEKAEEMHHRDVIQVRVIGEVN